MQVTYSVDGTPLDTLPENYCDHYVPEGFVLDESSELRDSYQFSVLITLPMIEFILLIASL